MHQGKTKKKKIATKAQVCAQTIYTGKREDDEYGKKKIKIGITRAINQCPILMVPSVGPDDIEPLSAPVQQRLYGL